MTSTLKPISGVKCPKDDILVSLGTCDKCEYMIEVRRPWRHFAVKCAYGNKHEGVYP